MRGQGTFIGRGAFGPQVKQVAERLDLLSRGDLAENVETVS